MTYSNIQKVLLPEQSINLYKNTVDKNMTFNAFQTFMRIIFKNGVGRNKSTDALVNHYGSKESVLEHAVKVIERLQSYELQIVKMKLNPKNSNQKMRSIERELSIFGMDSEDWRSTELIRGIREGIVSHIIF